MRTKILIVIICCVCLTLSLRVEHQNEKDVNHLRKDKVEKDGEKHDINMNIVDLLKERTESKKL